jgi:hypothetical protein
MTTAPMKLEFSGRRTYLEVLRPGLPVSRQQPRLSRRAEFHGTVKAVNSRIDPVTRSIRVRATLPNPEHLLRPGLLMNVTCAAGVAHDGCVIPEEALLPLGEQAVRLVVNATARSTTRELQMRLGVAPGWSRVVKGLAAGETGHHPRPPCSCARGRQVAYRGGGRRQPQPAELLRTARRRRYPMMLSDVSVTRPVFASVMSLLLIAFGLLSFERLPLREYPDIDPPIVYRRDRLPGRGRQRVENRVTKLIEERIAGVEGIRFIASSSEDGRSRITLEFAVVATSMPPPTTCATASRRSSTTCPTKPSRRRSRSRTATKT